MDKPMCESCGKVLDNKDEYFVEHLEDGEGRTICSNCMWRPLDVLKDAYESKTFEDAKKVIEEFDEECEDSFLHAETQTTDSDES